MALFNETLSVLALQFALRTASANGSTVDRTPAGNAYEQALFVIAAGAITDGTFTPVIQESNDGTSWSNVPAGRLSSTLGAISANVIQEVGVNSDRRYLRANITVGGSPATGGTVGAIAILGDPSTLPAR